MTARFASRDVPQANSLAKVLGRVRELADVEGETFALSPRHVAYYTTAARVLGWLDDAGAPTEIGRVAAHAAPGLEVRAFGLAALERCALVRAWMDWSGCARVSELRGATAGAFLLAASDLGESTATRRGQTLSAWLAEVAPLDVTPFDPVTTQLVDRVRGFHDGIALPPHAVRFLAEPVDLRVPTRMASWAARSGVVRFADLVARAPSSLLAEKNLGRTSLAATAGVMERATGLSWERLRELSRASARGEAAPADEGARPTRELAWDELAKRCPPSLRALPLTRVALPQRFLTFVCAPEGLETLGQLLDRPEAELRAIPKLGRRSMRDGRDAIAALLEDSAAHEPSGAPVAPPELDLDALPELLTHVLGRAARLPPLDRLVFTRRAGFHGEVPTLEDLGETLGVSRERVRQLEQRACRTLAREWWTEAARGRLRAALTDGVIALEALAEDPFFGEAGERPDALDFLLDRVIESELRVVSVDEELVLAPVKPKEVALAYDEVTRSVRRLDFPVPLEEPLAIAREGGAALVPGLGAYFERDLASKLTVATRADGARVATGVGDRAEARVLAFLEQQPAPVRREVLDAAMGGRARIPDKVVYVARGVIGLPKHIPDFERWTERLAPLCVAVMREEDPSRQWAVPELFEEIAVRAQLPAWLGPWHLASMLRVSGQVRYLGRLQVSLDHDDAPEERRHIRDVLRDILVARGAPMTFDDIERAAADIRGTSEAAIRMSLLSPPFVQIDEHRFGLIDRDVAGGSEAFAEAANELEAELERRQEGLGPAAAWRIVRELSPVHEGWSLETAKAAARAHQALRINRSGGIGLASWEDARLPTRRDLVASMVEEAGGRCAIEEILDALEHTFGHRPPRPQLLALASSCDLVVQGKDLARPDAIDAPPDEAALDAVLLPLLPPAVRPLYRELLAQPVEDLGTLREEATRYAARFDEVRDNGGLVDPEEARAVARAARALLDCVEREGRPDERRLVQAAVRYFVTADDADNDFLIGGLDDDIAVLDAVARHLGRPDCAVQRPPASGDPEWMTRLPKGPVRALFARIAAYGCVTEAEAMSILGGARAMRRFAREIETLARHAPFEVGIRSVDGTKRYVRGGARA